jgi:hypothetical protein
MSLQTASSMTTPMQLLESRFVHIEITGQLRRGLRTIFQEVGDS